MNELLHLVLAIGISAPVVNYVGYGDDGKACRYVDFTLCQTVEIASVIETNGIFSIQVSQTVDGQGWEDCGELITGPTYGTNYQTLAVPAGEGFFRLVQKQWWK